MKRRDGPGPEDERHLRRAVQLARRGEGFVEPNPMVGCVLVRDGRVIGEGYHRRFGGPHAEVEALRHCTQSPRGATAYVSLEPCCHYDKTPPCTDALIAAGVARVVAPLMDADPRVAGGGFEVLRKAGIQVDVGALAAEAADVNAPFIKLVREHRPWVILKWAQSLDGKIATRTGDSKWITDETCRAHAHRTRGRVDAILVGVGTVLTDDPALTCRVGRPRRIATRIVLDTHLRTPLRAQVVHSARTTPTWVFHASDAPPRRARALQQAGCVLHRVKATRTGLSLPAILDVLGGRRMTNVLVEGGGRVLGQFFDQRLADEFYIYVAAVLIGGAGATGALHASGRSTVSAALRLPADAHMRALGSGYFIAARTHRAREHPGT